MLLYDINAERKKKTAQTRAEKYEFTLERKANPQQIHSWKIKPKGKTHMS